MQDDAIKQSHQEELTYISKNKLYHTEENNAKANAENMAQQIKEVKNLCAN